MNKLKNKVFSVIFLIMTLVTVSVLAVYNVQQYNQQYNHVERSLNETMFERLEDMFERPDGKNPNGEDYGRLRFMDSTVYTVILDSDNTPSTVINHSDNNVSTDEITALAADLIEDGCGEKIGSLYFTQYSYKFVDGVYITIVDNSSTNSFLLKTLVVSVALLLILETLIFLISRKIAFWITDPVAESFDKQKRFIADASHELKTPLAVIMASADALESNPSEKKWLDNIKSESDRMNKLVADLLELAKSEEVGDETVFAVGSLSKLVEKSALTFESVMFEKGVVLKDNIQSDVEMNMNEFKMTQLVSILLDNAVKHSDTNSEITVELKKDKDITLSVSNKGAGIPAGDEEKIFERFYRADEARNRNENRYGLGLAIAKNIVISHGGTITAKSENGYTTFTVKFKAK